MTDIHLPKLADTRSTQRLLNIVRQLEDHVGNLQAMGGTEGAVPVEGEIARLREQNRQLKTRQRHAVSRLDDLLSRMEKSTDTVETAVGDAA